MRPRGVGVGNLKEIISFTVIYVANCTECGIGGAMHFCFQFHGKLLVVISVVAMYVKLFSIMDIYI